MEKIILISAIVIIGPILGSLLGVFKKCSPKVLFNFLGFAAGIMLAISLITLLPKSFNLASPQIVLLGLIVGPLIIFLVDKLIPHIHASHKLPETSESKLQKAAVLIIIGIFIHNIPEGLAIGMGSLQSVQMSLAITLGIAIHDIPEAVCTSLPYYAATGKRLKSFLVSASTVIPTLFGIYISYFFLGSVSPILIGFLMASTAGLMIFVAADELLPTSFRRLRYASIFPLTAGFLTVTLLTLL